MFAQKPPKIKEAIFDYLRGIEYKTEAEIVANVKYTTTGFTPDRSINVVLNRLAKQGTLSKAFLLDGTFYSWTKDKRYSRLTRYYKLIYEYTRKMISTVMYAGSNSILGSYSHSPQNNPNNLLQPEWKAPRKTPSDLKAWTYDIPENKNEDRKRWLVEQLLLALQNRKEAGWFPQVDMGIGLEDNDINVDELLEALNLDEKGRYITHESKSFGYDDSQTKPQVNTDEIYKNFKWSIRGVEQ